MAGQDYTPIMNVLGNIKCTICHPKSNLTFNREFEFFLLDSRESSAWISQKAININILKWLRRIYFFPFKMHIMRTSKYTAMRFAFTVFHYYWTKCTLWRRTRQQYAPEVNRHIPKDHRMKGTTLTIFWLLSPNVWRKYSYVYNDCI